MNLGHQDLGARTLRLLRQVSGVTLILVVWWIASAQVGAYRLPSPKTVFSRFFPLLYHWKILESFGMGNHGIWPHLLHTARQTFLGATIGMGLGITVGLIMARVRSARDLLEPTLELVRTVPALAAIPFFIMWFGHGLTAQLGILVFFGFLGMVIFTIEAIRNVPTILIKFARSLGASESQIFRTVILRAILPELTAALRLGIVGAWGMQLIAEMIGSPRGMGQVFVIENELGAVDLLIVSVMWVGVAAYTSDLLLRFVFGYVNRWKPREA